MSGALDGLVALDRAAFARLGQDSAHDDAVRNAIGRHAFADDIFTEARPILHAENAPDRTGSRSYRAAYDRAHWPGCPTSLCRSFLRATDRALCACWTGSNQRNE